MTSLAPGPRMGKVAAPPSKSHEHRLLVADFLAGDFSRLAVRPADSDDVKATKRCLAALAEDSPAPVLDCGESGSTRRFLAPVAAALGKRPTWKMAGRLASRPAKDYPSLAPGLYEIAGDVSSQFVTGLLFALPLLDGDSRIRFVSPLESRGYVDLTLAVVAGAGVRVVETPDGFAVPGRQRFRAQPSVAVEGDWSGAAFWLAMNRLGGEIEVTGLNPASAQPDRCIAAALADWRGEIDVSQFPDSFPALCVVAARQPRPTRFVGVRRLRIKECDRVAAMAEMLARFGVGTSVAEDSFVVRGSSGAFVAKSPVRTFGDHRIAMSAAVAASASSAPVEIDDAECSAKSYPGFFSVLSSLAFRSRG